MAHSYAPRGGDIKSQNHNPVTCTTAPMVVQATERRAQIMKWRREKNLSYWELAQKAKEHFGVENLPKGYDRRYAWRDVRHALDETLEELWFNTGQFIAEEKLRLDDMEWRIRQRLVGVEGNEPELGDLLKAVDRLLKISQRRSKLLGLDSPNKMEVKHTHVQDAPEAKKLDALKRIAESLRASEGERGTELLGRLVNVKNAKVIDSTST